MAGIGDQGPWSNLKCALSDAGCKGTATAVAKTASLGALDTISIMCKQTVLPARSTWMRVCLLPSDNSGTFKQVFKCYETNAAYVWFRDPLDGVGEDAITEILFVAHAVKTYGKVLANEMFGIFDQAFLMYGKEGPPTLHEFGHKQENSVCALFHMPLYTPLPVVLDTPTTQRQKFRLVVSLVRSCVELSNMGWTHRDLKPANILVGDDGQCRVADFGSCVWNIKEANPDGIGKGRWLSCNQECNYQPTNAATGTTEVTMQVGNVKSPWFSLGVTLWELLSGFPPWKYTGRIPLLGFYQTQFYEKKYGSLALCGLVGKVGSIFIRRQCVLQYVAASMMTRDTEWRMSPIEAMWLLHLATHASADIFPTTTAGNVCCIITIQDRRARTAYAQHLFELLQCASVVEPLRLPSLCHTMEYGAPGYDGPMLQTEPSALFAWFTSLSFQTAEEVLRAAEIPFVCLDFATAVYTEHGDEKGILRERLDTYVSG